MSKKIKPLVLPDEKLRLEMKNFANQVRMKFSLKGLSDVFDILNEEAFFIRKPMETKEISGFTTYFEEEFIVFLNSSFTLGHERFSGAHELYHLEFNKDILKREKLLFDEKEDEKANVFASEFLMPEDYVKEKFHKLINIDKNSIEAKHVVKMNTFFKVSYTAMLKRMIQLNLCDASRYEYLRDYATVERSQELQKINKKEGYDISLIVPSNITSIPKEYLEMIKKNYENEKISYGALTKWLGFSNLKPEDIGIDEPMEDEWV